MNFGSLIPWRERPRPTTRHEQRDDPFPAIDAFRRGFDRVIEDFFTGMGSDSRPFARLTPSVDVEEEDKHIVVTAEVPGLDEKDLDITVAGDVLTIRGEKKAASENRNGNSYYVERQFGSFSRSVQLPYEIGEGAVDATYAKGVLTVRLPKPADAQREVRRIEVKAS